VSGLWARARRVVYVALIALWVLLPWIPVGGHPAVFLDIGRRQFFLFGATFNAQDIWLVFFLLTGFGFGLFYLTTLFGRVWCGWACPQTVFIEAVFRPIERLVNGPRNVAMRRAEAPLSLDRAWRTALTQGLYLIVACFVAHVFVAYFVSLPELFAMVRAKPAAHLDVFVWMLATTALFYVAFGAFREQFCVVLCPYGRLQSAMLDDDTVVIGYDERRGEPRGKATAPRRGDCVDCGRCVAVCPTGIDIRDGLQLDCIACTACVDACDAVMNRLGRSRGLVRHDSLRGFRGEARRILRPRVWVYTAFLVIGIVAATLATRTREPFEANVLRLAGTPYTRSAGKLTNGFELHLVNKTSQAASFVLAPTPAYDLEFILPMARVDVEPLGSRRVPFFVTMEESRFTHESTFVIRVESARGRRDVTARFLGAAEAR
jgi:cytochrome c oxidase accessory protein FixG